MIGKIKERMNAILISSAIRLYTKRVAETKPVLTLIVAGLVFAILFPIVMSQVVSANTAGWNSAVAVVFTVLFPVLLIISLVLYLTGRIGR